MTVNQLIDYLKQAPDGDAEVMLVAEDEACTYRPVVGLIPMVEGRIVIAANGDYDRVIKAQSNKPKLRLTREDW